MTLEPRVVVDASALVAWACQERGAVTIDKILPVAIAPSSVMVETLYRCLEKGHRMPLEELHLTLLSLGLRVEPVIDEDTVRAAALIHQSRREGPPNNGRALSLGDGLCLAVAERLQLPITGGDEYWETLELAVRYQPFR
jgi:PIN domain nuclease of toxin-antitoxin system